MFNNILNEEKIITDHLDLNKISYVPGISYIDNEKVVNFGFL